MQKGPLWGGGQSHLAVPWTSLHTPLFLQGFGKQISRSEVEETKKLRLKQKNKKRRRRKAYSTACFCLLTRIFVLVSLMYFCTYMYTSLPSLKKNIGRSLNLYHLSVSNTIYFSATTKVFSCLPYCYTNNIGQYYLYIFRLCILLHRCIWSHLVSRRK